MYAFWLQQNQKGRYSKGTYIVRVLGTDGEYRVAAVLLFGDGASAGVIRKELRRFGRVQERFWDALRREEYSPVASGGKRISNVTEHPSYGAGPQRKFQI